MFFYKKVKKHHKKEKNTDFLENTGRNPGMRIPVLVPVHPCLIPPPFLNSRSSASLNTLFFLLP